MTKFCPVGIYDDSISQSRTRTGSNGGGDAMDASPPAAAALEELRRVCASIGTKMLKSAMQKLIRLRLGVVVLPSGATIAGAVALRETIRRLCHPDQPSQFNPDIGASVRAVTSCAKRLGVILLEDAQFHPDRAECLFAAALLSHRMPSWRPNKELIRTWEKWAIDMLSSSRTTKWEENCERVPFVKRTATTDAKRASLLLDALRSLSGDHLMYRATAYGRCTVVEATSGQPIATARFPDVAIDQHTHPTIALSLSWVRPGNSRERGRASVEPHGE